VNPDIVWMPETLKRPFSILLRDLEIEYPYHFPETVKEMPNQGSVLFSKYPISTRMILTPLGTDVDGKTIELKIVHAVTDVQGTRVDVMGLHLVSPKNATRLAMHGQQLSYISGYVLGKAELPKDTPLVILGDMNSVPWHPSFQTFMELIGVHSTASLLTLPLSWPSWMPYPLQIPIDQILLSSNICHNGMKLGRYAGSDHLPVYVDVKSCP
jgi:endonuclease/exonuclease/phosphatase (EEP) superfamily protein YafD